mmetsp:Transcript_4315/g.4739  ORF Transcript_4315/g.4739 Transcript_4315/m.4739 type:complete len:333 (+) Transcript_4315:160-1158(+)
MEKMEATLTKTTQENLALAEELKNAIKSPKYFSSDLQPSEIALIDANPKLTEETNLAFALIQKRCKELVKEIEKKRAQLSKNNEKELLKNAPKKKLRVKFLEAKIQRLASEIQVLDKPIEFDAPVESNHVILRARIRAEADSSIEQYDVAIDDIKQRIAQKKKKCDDGKRLMEELKMINQGLQELLVQQSSDMQDTKPKRTFEDIHKEKIKLLDESNAVLTKRMTDFMDEHFPERTVHANERHRAKRRRVIRTSNTINDEADDNQDDQDRTYCGLGPMLEKLMNKLVLHPDSPWVRIEPQFFPPYIELLLRAGIVLKDPRDSSMIKLEAFHN